MTLSHRDNAPMPDPFLALMRRRMFARDNLPGWRTAAPDTGRVHGPELPPAWVRSGWIGSAALYGPRGGIR